MKINLYFITFLFIFFSNFSCASINKSKNYYAEKKYSSCEKINTSNIYKRLEKIVNSYIGTPYKSGGTSRNGFDCSGFVITVFLELNKIKLPRSTKDMQWVGTSVSKSNLKVGDLVFFRDKSYNRVNHVGIYMGNNTFVHASTSCGVRYDKLDDEYYKKHFVKARRILK
jgi:lipoprotein Spr